MDRSARIVRVPGVLGIRKSRAFAALAALAIVAAAGMASAAPPTVEFDVPYLVGCRDVTPVDFAAMNPDERLLEARFQISSLIRHGQPNELFEFFYRIESPEKSLQIVDHQPRTTLATDIVGHVGIEKKEERSNALGARIAGTYDHIVSGDVTASTGKKTSSSVKFEQLPPLDLLAASGTTQRGCGVYYQLKPSPRTSLEGARDFVLMLRVPNTWRGDYVHVRCEAIGHRRGGGHWENAPRYGSAELVVALYAEGDSVAKTVALEAVRAELTLRRVADEQAKLVRGKAYPSLTHKFAVLVSATDPKIPDNWLRQIVTAPAGAPQVPFERHLPDEVRQAAHECVAARQRLHEMCGHTLGRVDQTAEVR